MTKTIRCGAFRLYLDGKSPYWQVRAEAAPRMPLYESTKETNQTLALRKAKEIYAAWSNEKKFEPGEQILFKDLWKHYFEEQATYQKSATMKRIESVGQNHLVPVFGNRFLTEVKGLWSQFVRREKINRPTSTLFNERKYLLGALQFAHENDYIPAVPFLQSIRKDRRPMRTYADKEIRRMLGYLERYPKERWAMELKLQIVMGFAMGPRHGEMSKLELRHINQKQRTVHFESTKTRVDRIIQISDVVWPLLAEQIEYAEDRGSRLLFPQVHSVGAHKDQRVFDEDWQEMKRELGIKGRFHDLRHTCAKHLKRSHVPPAIAAAYLGMSLRTYDSTYGRLDTEDTKEAATVVILPNPVASPVGGFVNDGD